MRKSFETWTICKRALIVLPTGCDTSELQGRHIMGELEESRHAECRKLSRRLTRIAWFLAAINVFLSALLWQLLPTID